MGGSSLKRFSSQNEMRGRGRGYVSLCVCEFSAAERHLTSLLFFFFFLRHVKFFFSVFQYYITSSALPQIFHSILKLVCIFWSQSHQHLT